MLILRDPGRLRQVLVNLLGNAVKFSQRGGVLVQVSLEREQGSHVWIRFEVKDQGIGIAPETIDKLFAPFTQANGSTTRKYESRPSVTRSSPANCSE
jgi:two-component system, sensor histidine kinase and response regulator